MMRWVYFLLLCSGIATAWVTGRWAVSVVQSGIVVLAAAWWWNARKARWTMAMVPLAAMAGWGFAQVAMGTSVQSWASEEMGYQWVTRWAAFFLGVQMGRGNEWFGRAAFVFGFGVSVVAVLMHFFVPGLEAGVMGPFVYHNQYAAFMELVIPVGLWLGFSGSRGWMVWTGLSAWMVASVVLSNSRAGSALVFAEVILVAWLSHVKKRRLAWVLGAVLLFTGVVGWDKLLEKLEGREPYQTRQELMLSSITMAGERPWMGFGLGTWATVYPAYAQFDDGLRDNQAHNDWAQWAAEGGVPFVLLMMWWVMCMWRPAWRGEWGVGVLVVLVHCLLEYHFQQRAGFGYFYFAMAGVVAGECGNGQRESV